MDIEQINVDQFSDLLRQRETDIIEGNNKLSLTASLLQKINYALQNLEYDRVSSSNSSTVPKEPLKFLQDIIHKTPKLTVTQKIKRETWRVDLSRFANLKYLELSRIPMHLVEGMQALRSQLEVLICERCTDCLEEILGTSDVWEELRTAKLCYNDLVFLCPFTNTPWLQYLDLSYNKIEDKLSLQSLKTLKYLNLSFNFLTSVPMLSEEVCHTLKVLLINNNYVQDLAAIGVFDNLEVLDVSHNVLADHPAISPILFLPNLRSINLSCNPISYHPLHRFHTCSYLNKEVIPDEFLLDGKPLSLLEQQEIGRRGETYKTYGISAPKDITCLPSGSLTQSVSKSVSKKKVRDVVIEDGSSNSKPKAPVKIQEVDQKHLETKKQFEELRERYGDDHWLLKESGSFVQDLMGLQRSTGNGALSSTPLTSDVPSSSPKLLPSLEKIPSVINHFDSSASEDYVTALTTQAIIEKIPHFTDTSESSDQEQRDQFLNNTGTESEEVMTTAESGPQNTSEESTKEEGTNVEEEEPEEEQDDSQLWIVKRKSQDSEENQLFLTLNEREIREKSVTTARTITRWSLELVESCEKVANDPPTVKLTFNTIRKPYRERIYIMDHSEAQELLKRVRSFLEARSLSAMNQVAYRCMKCSSMFSIETQPTVLSSLSTFDKVNTDATKCPACGSTLVVKMEEAPLPSSDKDTGPLSPLRHSPSDCSIGSAASLEQRVDGESEKVGDIGVGGGGKEGTPTPRRYDSDIEVISNPSQSSIEVLEVQARLQGVSAPSRKRSNEERTTVAVPQLNTVPEVQPNTGSALTESSSSGSLTDSVCTAYESNPVPARRGGMSDVPEEATPTATYTSLLEGLIQSVTSKLTPKNSPSVDSVLDNDSQYSYTDFSKVDHRVKFYLYQNIFKDDNEELSFVLKGQLVDSNGDVVEGCLVVSSHYLYVLEVVSPEVGDDASAWFQSKTSYHRSEISSVFMLPWQLGVGFSLKTITHLILLPNAVHTSNFIKFIINFRDQDDSLENVVVTEDPSLKPEKLLQQQITQNVSASDGPVGCNVQHLALIGPAIITRDSEVVKVDISPLVITSTELWLLHPNFGWLMPSVDSIPTATSQQKVANVVDMSLSGLDLKLRFYNEDQNQEETWNLTFSSLNSVNLIIESVRGSWEQLFSVPLQLSKH